MKAACILSKFLPIVLGTAALILSVGGSTLSSASDWPGLAVVPAPSGQSKVGSLSVRLIDSARPDPFFRNGAKRELMVRFWYPAVVTRNCGLAEYSSPKVRAYLSEISGIAFPVVSTNGCLNAPVADGLHPVIVFSHGFTGMFTDSTFLFEDLASRGYVVASLAHTYESTAVEFPGGRLAKSVFGSYLNESALHADDQSLRFARSVRLGDLRFLLDELERMNTGSGAFAGRLDTSRIGVMGHSLGGEVALSSLQREGRFRAGVLLDAPISDDSAAGTGKPVLILAAGRERWRKQECELWRNLHGPRLAVNVRGADHFTLSDAVWLFKGLPGLSVPAGAMRRERTISAVRNYIAAFFDTNLLGKSTNALLTGQPSRYPFALVTTQQQQLCRDNPAVAKGGLQ